MYITASSTISFQPTFRNKGFSDEISELNDESEILHPDYTDFIPKMKRRRMTDVLKMGITCAMDCLKQIDLEQPDSIIVGTSMGCNIFTKRFLDKINSSKGGLLSPTSFIVSTHNTIAGQISLLLSNHNYNMTHTQNSLSFEQALMDGMLCILEGGENILVGSSDENERELYNMVTRLNNKTLLSTYGASFFILSKEKKEKDNIKLVEAESFGLVEDRPKILTQFLNSNKTSVNDIDLVLYSNSVPETVNELIDIFPSKKLYDFQKITGTYLTNSGFAMNYGVDILTKGNHPSFEKNINRVLIYNNLIPENLGLILIEKNSD